MTHLRILALALVLSGCDENAPTPPAAPVPAEPMPPPTRQEVQQAPAAPEKSPAPVRRPPESRVVVPAPPASPPTATVTPGSNARARTPPVEEVAELQSLDLSLPEEWLEAVEPGKPLQLEPVLPSLFGEEITRDYRLNGRLIESNDDEHMFEGAELRLEIRR